MVIYPTVCTFPFKIVISFQIMVLSLFQSRSKYKNTFLNGSACVAAVKVRPVLHHCVVIFFWSSWIMECTSMLFTFENGVPLMR